jgi:multimeric flavodoxin WrbA
MEVLGINGSPNENGNTAYALRFALSRLEDAGIGTTYIGLASKTINYCDGCFSCRSGACVFGDDMEPIIAALLNCDCVLLASPVYMGMVTGKMKTMMDRTVMLRAGGEFRLTGKIGAGIACGGFRNGGQELTLQCMHTFFLQQDMYAIADGPRFSHSGATIVGDAREDEVGLRTVANLANKIAGILQSQSRLYAIGPKAGPS